MSMLTPLTQSKSKGVNMIEHSLYTVSAPTRVATAVALRVTGKLESQGRSEVQIVDGAHTFHCDDS